jgi:hypothetical protein
MVKTVGEHWTCAMLARHGWAPALTRDGIARTDILAVATHIETRPSVEIQVKGATAGAKHATWLLGNASQLAASEHEWFVFVMVPTPALPPRGFVVPRDHVVGGAVDHPSQLDDQPEGDAGQSEHSDHASPGERGGLGWL